MKLQFKQQPYQTDATMAVVRCFEGQSKGFRKEVIGRETLDHGLFGTEVKVEEIFSNKKLEITEADILKNVQTLQKEQGLKTISNWMDSTLPLKWKPEPVKPMSIPKPCMSSTSTMAGTSSLSWCHRWRFVKECINP
jgi:hypothetical protein